MPRNKAKRFPNPQEIGHGMLCFNSFVFVQKFEESAGVWVALQRLLLHGDSGLRGRGTHRVVGIIQEKGGKNTYKIHTFFGQVRQPRIPPPTFSDFYKYVLFGPILGFYCVVN